MLYRVTKEQADTNQGKIACNLENTLLSVFVASKGGLLIEQFQMECDQLPEKTFKPLLRINCHAKVSN